MTIAVCPYKKGSASARELANGLTEALGRKVWRVRNTAPRNVKRTVINWGSTQPINGKVVINHPSSVQVASNKSLAFAAMNDAVPVPAWTCQEGTVKELFNFSRTVVARTILNGHSGQGIVIFGKDDPIPKAPLYTAYIPKKKEFRVHVFRDKIVDVVQKRKVNGYEGGSPHIRTHNNGWVFCRENLEYDPSLLTYAINAVAALKLDFGAVDIVYNEKKNVYYVLEVNTAPGLEGQTVKSYVDVFKELV
jgi:glutathione synthase/RimK-type ligase-like ATP-grasp enzyme